MLDRTTLFIREHVGAFKLADTYDILDPETQQPLGIAKEKPSAFMHVLRFLVNKRTLPTTVYIYHGTDPNDESQLAFSIKRGFTLLRSRVDICDPKGNVLGFLKSKAISLGGAFRVFDVAGNEVASVKGDWKGWNFRFADSQNNELGQVTKKWAGMGKELFTSADNYIISLAENTPPEYITLLIAAGLAIDTVFKEK